MFFFFFFTLIAWECVFCWFVNFNWRTLKGMMGCGAPAPCDICQLSNAAFVQTSNCHFCPRMCSPSFKGWMISGNLNVALSSASAVAASQSCYEISKVRLLMEWHSFTAVTVQQLYLTLSCCVCAKWENWLFFCFVRWLVPEIVFSSLPSDCRAIWFYVVNE